MVLLLDTGGVMTPNAVSVAHVTEVGVQVGVLSSSSVGWVFLLQWCCRPELLRVFSERAVFRDIRTSEGSWEGALATVAAMRKQGISCATWSGLH